MAEQQNFCDQEDLEESIETILEEEVIAEDENLSKTDGSAMDSEIEEIEEVEEAGSEEAKKGFFGKKKDKKDKKDLQIEDLSDRLKRNLAEFDNYRKRTEKEKFAMYEVGAREIIEKILPVLDNFERGLGTVLEEDAADAFVEGMNKVYKQLMTTLEELGVSQIEALGNEFNPDFHNAVMHVEDEEAGENKVIEEYQKGYTYHGTVIRYSMVKVAN